MFVTPPLRGIISWPRTGEEVLAKSSGSADGNAVYVKRHKKLKIFTITAIYDGIKPSLEETKIELRCLFFLNM